MSNAADFVIKNSKLKKYKGSGGVVVIPDGVTGIGNWAFEGCTGLTGIEIPSSVTSIGGYAFKGCTGLTGITIPGGVTSIGWSAFEGCTGLADIKISSSVTSIGEHAFEGCPGLPDIKISDSKAEIGEHAFEGCPGLPDIKISDSKAEIGEHAFEDHTDLPDIKMPSSMSNAADFVIENGELKKYRGSGGVVVIPDSVTSIGWSAFEGCTGLTGITIPDSVTDIGWSAFYGCTSLTGITIPDSVTSIGREAFKGCTGLTGVTIPKRVTSIGGSAFEGCTGLTSMVVESGNPVYHSDGNCIIQTSERVLVAGCQSSVIPADDSVTRIGDRAFYKCTGLTGITIPDSVTSIGWHAFEGCTSLTGITIPGSVTSIGGYAFKGCTGFTGITIPDSVTDIGLRAFEGCTGLTGITIPNSVTSIEACAFEGCTGLTGITIPDSVTSIGSSAFEGCTGLTGVTIPKRVTSIGWHAFEGCTGLTGITIPDSVTSIDGEAFKGCTGLTGITIPDSVTSIGREAFKGCTGLTGVTIPKRVTSIGGSAFEGCTGLTSMVVESGNPVYHSDGNCIIQTSERVLVAGCQSSVIPADDSVTRIGDRAFYKCTGLTGITIPDSVTSIDPGAFEGCTGLTGITIPNSVTSIGDAAFRGCTGLTSMIVESGNPVYHSDGNCIIQTSERVLVAGCQSSVIPADGSVTRIDDRAFLGCTGLTGITIPNSVTGIGSSAFKGCTGLTGVTIPDSVTGIGYAAFSGCTGLTSVTIPAGVTSIGEDAFYGCTGLTSAGPIGGDHNIEFGWTKTIPANAFYNCASLTGITIPDSVTYIGGSAFEGCTGLTGIEIPSSVTRIGDEAFGGCNNLKALSIANPKCVLGENFLGYTLPHGLIDCLDALAPHFNGAALQQYVLSEGMWDKLSLRTQAKIFLEQQGKDALAFYAENVTNVEELGKALLEVLPQKPSVKECGAIALFMTRHSRQASSALLQQMYERLKPLKPAEKALKTIEANLELMTKLQPKTLSPLEQRMMEVLQKQGLSGNAQDVMLKEYYGITLSELPKVQCKDGSTAPASALGWLLTAHEKYYEPEEYKGTIKAGRKEVCVAYTKLGLCPEAEEILAELDSAGFQNFLHELVQNTLSGVERGKKLYLAYPISRYADEERMAELVKIASSLRKKTLVEIFENASLYNNTRAAMLFADKRGCLYGYAKLRGTTEDDLRDTILSDVGIDENGGKTYDLGNQTVTARMQADLSFLIELPDGKTAKSLPKKGADAEKYAAANTDFSNVKKNVKKIAKNRKDVLFEEFLSGKSRSAQSWCNTYLSNPVLKSVASLLVWRQRNLTFTLKNGQPVDSAGQPYQIRPSTPIALAHPMEMDSGVVRAWQMYFVSKGIKQPFIQIWEPVIDPTTIRRDRYKGLRIPGYRLMSQDKHGITIEYERYDRDTEKIVFSFSECDVSIKRLVEPGYIIVQKLFGRPMIADVSQRIDPQEFFEILDFAFKKYTRQVNHIVGLLDKGTIRDLIVKDDVSIVDRLSSFTLAQIEEFLKLAMDNNCMNVTAALLEFKNANFAGFDPMAEFTLDF